MVRNHIFITLLLCLVYTVTIAEPQQDPAKDSGKSVEETERQKIITELSYRLDTKLSCRQKLIWSDKGSGADLDGFFFAPSAESSYFIIGGCRRKISWLYTYCINRIRFRDGKIFYE